MGTPPSNGTIAYRVDQLEHAIQELRSEIKEEKAKLDRLILSVVGAALSFTVTVIILAVTRNV